jgi:hypothetical protein
MDRYLEATLNPSQYVLSDNFMIESLSSINGMDSIEVFSGKEVLNRVAILNEQKLAGEAKAAAELKTMADATKKKTINCVKGKLTKKVTSVKPKCPAGYKKK